MVIQFQVAEGGKRKRINFGKYAGVFIASALIFVLGIVVGQQLEKARVNELDSMLDDVRTQIAGAELHYILSTKNPCDLTGFKELANQLDEMSERITTLENAFGKNNEDVLRLTNYYSTLQIRHWLLAQEIKDKCDQEYVLVLYFYSNVEGECPKCVEQGDILTVIRKRNSNMYTYAFNVNLNNLALNTIKSTYGVTKDVPVIVINDKKYDGFKSTREVDSLLLVG